MKMTDKVLDHPTTATDIADSGNVMASDVSAQDNTTLEEILEADDDSVIGEENPDDLEG